MNEIKSQAASKKRADKVPTSARKADGTEGKRVPNSLVATLRAIRRLWCEPGIKTPRHVEEFAVDFSLSFQKVIELYPAYRDESKDIHKLIERLEDTGKNTSEICYYHLRAYAEYIELPVGILVLFSHVLGDATAGKKKAAVLDLINRSCDALKALHHHIDNNTVQDALYKPRDQDNPKNPRYNAKIDGLKIMYNAYWPERPPK